MKYLIIILAIICSVSLLTLFFIWPDPAPNSTNVAATVNGHNLSQKSILRSAETAGHHGTEYADILDSAIYRELLIQEAQRLDLDKEESFRLSLQGYYEESLIKTLLDRQHRQPVTISEVEVDAYLALFGKEVTFTRFPGNGSDTIVSGHPAPPAISQNKALFDDLADPLKLILSTLKPGEQTAQFDTGNDQYTIRLDGVNSDKTIATQRPPRLWVRQRLENHKAQQQFATWLYQLRSNASITIHKE